MHTPDVYFHHKLALEFNCPQVQKLLDSMSIHDLRSWEAFFYVESGGYEKAQKKKNSLKAMQVMLGPLKRKNG